MRNKAIDMAKGLGMIWIIMSHSGYYFPLGKYFYYMYVPIFFVSFGYTYKLKDSIKKDIKYVLKHLLLPLLTCRLFCIAFNVFTDIYYGTMDFSNKKLLLIIKNNLYSRYCLYPYFSKENIYFNSYGGSEWFLPTLILSSLLFIYIYRYRIEKNSIIVYPITTVVLLIVTIYLDKLPILLPWGLDVVPMSLTFIIFGSILKEYRYMDKVFNKKLILIYFLLVVVLVLIANYNLDINLSVRIFGLHGGISVFLYYLNCCIACFLSLTLCKCLVENNFFYSLEIVGKHSLILYITNGQFMELFTIITNILDFQESDFGIFCLMKVLFSTCVGIFINYTYTKVNNYMKNNSL